MSRRVPEVLDLKVKAQVVLLKNLDVDAKLVNGSRGIVDGFEEVAVASLPEKMRAMLGGRPTIKCPRVRFDCGVTRVIEPHDSFAAAGGAGAMIRVQIPLRLAWAITVHKSQGMTLSRAEVEVDDAFDDGQVYVALSRCVSLDGLWVSGATLDQSSVHASSKVRAFYGI